jgi:asparagine synthase (glutamine-hydrolysing)
MEMADFTPFVFHGVRPQDPTAHQRLVELALQAPADLLVDETLGRPMFEAAFADILPPRLLVERRRGRQAADWWTAFEPELLRRAFGELSREPLVTEVLDFGAAEPLLATWPRSFEDAFEREDEYQDLLGSLSIALFLVENFPSQGR